MNDMIQHLWSRFLHVADAIFDTLEQGTSFESFQHKLKEELDALGKAAIRLVIEKAEKRLRDNRYEQRVTVIAQRNYTKTHLSEFSYSSMHWTTCMITHLMSQ